MAVDTEKYEHSGGLGLAPIVVPVVGLVSAAIVATAYSFANVFNPCISIVSFLLLIVPVLGVGFPMAWAGKASGCRNPAFLALAGFGMSFVTLYFAWAAFFAALAARDDIDVGLFDILINPVGMWERAGGVAENGWYTLGSGDSATGPSGILLWILWVIEALIFMIGIPLVAMTGILEEVYCERCGVWCKTAETIALGVPIADGELDEAAVERITEGDVATLEALDRVSVGSIFHLELELKECLSCHETATYRVQTVETKTDSDGDTSTDKNDLTGWLFATSDDVHRLESLGRKPIIKESERLAKLAAEQIENEGGDSPEVDDDSDGDDDEDLERR